MRSTRRALFSFSRALVQIDNLQEIIQQHSAQITGLEKERDFYYQKLRDVEVICQEPECEGLPHTQKILEILYATEVRDCADSLSLFDFSVSFVQGRI